MDVLEQKEGNPLNSASQTSIPLNQQLMTPLAERTQNVDTNEVLPEISAEMLEQARLKKEAQLLALKKKREEKKQLAIEEHQARLKQLQILLLKSEFYSQHIQNLMEKPKKTATKSRKSVYNKENLQSNSMGKPSSSKGNVNPRDNNNAVANKEQVLSIKQSGVTSQQELSQQGTRFTESGLEVSVRQPLLFEGGQMRDYQLDGYEWLKSLYLNCLNGMLADEMGLGKTIQCIALICSLVENGIAGPFLIVGPLSTLPNWMSEFKRFAPKIPVVLYHGSKDERTQKLKKFHKHTMVPGGPRNGVLPVVVTSYELAWKDIALFQRKVKIWQVLTVDEGHRIKNSKCRLVGALKMLQSKFRVLLTGTPLQNNLTELWSLLNFLVPEIFSDLNIFESWFEAEDLSTEDGNDGVASNIALMEERDNIVSTFHKILHPFMLRRVKTDVALELPPKKELLVFTPLTPLQDEMYRALLNKGIHDLLAPKEEPEPEDEEQSLGASSKRRKCTMKVKEYEADDDISFDEEAEWAKMESEDASSSAAQLSLASRFRTQTMNQGYLVSVNPCSAVMDMRKVVNHPYLLRFPVHPGTKEMLINEELVTSSGKMLVLDAMLAKLKQTGHKVLIFSQMVMMLDMIEEYMLLREYTYCRLDGSRSVEDRQESIKSFNTDPNMFAFLVSTRAGGLGLNLTGADTVIIYDSDWNPQCDLQAQDRCHRIGQTKPVVVYRLTTDGTIDRRMVERATSKRRLEKLVIKKGRFHGNKTASGLAAVGFSVQELLELLNSKDYVKSVTSNGYVYTDAELEQLLDRSDMQEGTEGAESLAGEHSHLYQVMRDQQSE